MLRVMVLNDYWPFKQGEPARVNMTKEAFERIEPNRVIRAYPYHYQYDEHIRRSDLALIEPDKKFRKNDKTKLSTRIQGE